MLFSFLLIGPSSSWLPLTVLLVDSAIAIVDAGKEKGEIIG